MGKNRRTVWIIYVRGRISQNRFASCGIGIAPFMSICKNATDKHLNSKITLFYGCRTENDATFKEEFEETQEENMDSKVVFAVNQVASQRSGATGVIEGQNSLKSKSQYWEYGDTRVSPAQLTIGIEGRNYKKRIVHTSKLAVKQKAQE